MSIVLALAGVTWMTTIYRCDDGSYSDQPCQGTVVQLHSSRPSQPYLPEPSSQAPDKKQAARIINLEIRLDENERPISWRCDTEYETWFQHSPCPRFLSDGTRTTALGVATIRWQVYESKVSRASACEAMEAIDQVNRRGYLRDERTTPYQKTAGKDPCKGHR